MTVTKQLFVGGAANGEFLEVPDHVDRHAVAVEDSPPYTSPDRFIVRQDVYRRERIAFSPDVWNHPTCVEFFVFEPMTAREALLMLIHHYQPE